MKKIFFTSLLSFLVSLQLFAQSSLNSTLRVRLSDGSQLSVIIDGRNYNRQGTRLTFGDLPAGLHRLRVYRLAKYDDRRPARASLVYAGSVRLTPETFNLATVNVINGTLDLQSNPIMYDAANPERTGDNPGSPKDDVHNYDRTEDVYANNDRGNEANDNTRTDRPVGTASSANSIKRTKLTPHDLEDIRTRVAKRITDTDKESLLKLALDTRSFTTAQVTVMLHQLSFESTKLDFAKWAYPAVIDRKNYWKLESEFTFSSSKEEFTNYIRTR